jgi:SNF2 family DNA or RNA helicase
MAFASNALRPLWPGFVYKPHQETGIRWMLDREDPLRIERGGLLCDEMGLGKTMEVIGMMLNSRKLETLLLCPKAVVAQWRSAAIRAHINVCEPSPTANGWLRPQIYTAGAPILFITNYEKLVGHPTLGKRSWSRIVLDEAHRVKNKAGQLYQSIAALEHRSLWAVTATPIINDLRDIRALLSLIGYESGPLTSYIRLTEVVSEACLHRSMEEMRTVMPELPDAPHIEKKKLDFLTEEEAEFYRGAQGLIMRRWRALEADNSRAMFQMLMRLRQLSLHPQIYINARKRESRFYDRPDWYAPSTKFIALQGELAAAEEPAKWIVFCQFHEEMEMLAEQLAGEATVWQYHGGMSAADKEAVLKETLVPVSGGHQVLLLQLQSGGVGLNLQHFTKIIFMSPWWTSALMDQAIGRAVRIGQKERVTVTMLVLKEEETMNIDAKMLEKAETKRGMLDMLFRYANKGEISHDTAEEPQNGDDEDPK